MKKRYYLAHIITQYDGKETTDKRVFDVREGEDANKTSTQILREVLTDPDTDTWTETDGVFENAEGDTIVHVDAIYAIPENDFIILKKYL